MKIVGRRRELEAASLFLMFECWLLWMWCDLNPAVYHFIAPERRQRLLLVFTAF